jgi:lysophospholipase L1-like esterase
MNRQTFLKVFTTYLLSLKLYKCSYPVVKSCPLYDKEEGWRAALPDGKNFRENPAFNFVISDPKLPRILLIGDSISIGYTPYVRELLQGKTNVYRIPDNGGDTGKGLQMLDFWLGKRPWQVIHFNWGLHDLKYFKDGKLDLGGSQIRSVVDYTQNLTKIVKHLKKTGAKLIWASTTPIPEGSNGRIAGDEIHYNRSAEEVMKDQGIPINDLYGVILPHLAEFQLPQNVHFTIEGSEFLGKRVAEKILDLL